MLTEKIALIPLRYGFISGNNFVQHTTSVRLNVWTVIRRNVSNKLKTRIKLCGPISVADYMKDVLTHPRKGYYMNKDVFGAGGDFITSPEISQLFGEMVAVWVLNEWNKIGSPQPFQLIELGPGRGTMMKDILRVFSKLKTSQNSLEVHLIEVSDELSKIQGANICKEWRRPSSAESQFYQEGVTAHGVPVHWYNSINHVPKKFSIVIAHEFFDALPIHKFQKTPKGWREVLIDIQADNPEILRFILSGVPTPASILLVKKSETRDHIEVSPLSGVIMQQLGEHIENCGGFALVADYGHVGEKGDTFRAFRKHELHDPLIEPGTADLTADVDFSFLKEAARDKLITFGPVPQHDFLKALHIDVRLQNLLAAAPKTECAHLSSGYKMIMDEKGMGGAFKFMSFFPAVLKELLDMYPPTGFQK